MAPKIINEKLEEKEVRRSARIKNKPIRVGDAEDCSSIAALESIRKLSSQLWHPCTFCGKMFSQSCDLQRHVRVHTGEKPFTCPVCLKTFNQQINLKVHFRTHTGEKPYECSVCNRAFNSTSDLKKHFRIHTGDKPFKCQLCDYCGVSSSHLKRHNRFKHPDLVKQ